MSKKAIFIIAQNNFRDEELFIPLEILESRDIKTVVASTTTDLAFGKLGAEVRPDLKIDDIDIKEYDALIFIGGRGAATFIKSPKIWELAQKFAKAKKIVAAICNTPSILANSGLLMGKQSTAIFHQEENLRSKGADYTGMPVEVDGKVITARNHYSAREFGEKIAWELEE